MIPSVIPEGAATIENPAMIQYLEAALCGSGLMPHGHCYLWTSGLVWLHVIADGLIVLAYFAIAPALVYFARRRKDFNFGWLLFCFASFILACGTTHLMEIWNVWHSLYWISGGVKALTALASVPTAIQLIRLIPAALALPSPKMLESANVALEAEIRIRRRAEERVQELVLGLEGRVAERTAELSAANGELLRQIAARERAEAGLRLFRNLVDHSSDTIEVIDPQTARFLDVNERGPADLGYTRAEYLALRVTDVDPTVLDWPQLVQKVRAKGSYTGVGLHRRKDGTTFPVEVYVSWVALDRDYIVASVRDITERKRLESEILDISEREQCRLGQDLHDGLGQELAGIAMLSKAHSNRLSAESHPAARAALDIAGYIRATIDSTRRLAKGLYPVDLSRRGLLFALADLAGQTSERLGLRCELEQNGPPPELAQTAQIHLYRIVQECIGNAIKHGAASRIVIGSVAGEGCHTFSVTDNGLGFEKPHDGSGMGLHIMGYRARVIGAEIAISKPAGGGYRVTCQLRGLNARTDLNA